MELFEMIKQDLARAVEEEEHCFADAADSNFLDAFAMLEIERIRQEKLFKYNLDSLGDELYSFINSLWGLMLEGTDTAHDMSNGSGHCDRNQLTRIKPLEYYVIKIMALSKILMLKENGSRPITIWGEGGNNK